MVADVNPPKRTKRVPDAVELPITDVPLTTTDDPDPVRKSNVDVVVDTLCTQLNVKSFVIVNVWLSTTRIVIVFFRFEVDGNTALQVNDLIVTLAETTQDAEFSVEPLKLFGSMITSSLIPGATVGTTPLTNQFVAALKLVLLVPPTIPAPFQ